jgi:hypothetical protein
MVTRCCVSRCDGESRLCVECRHSNMTLSSDYMRESRKWVAGNVY